MPNRAHLIGKCLFQIDIPGHGKEQAVYETISALSKEKLPALLEEWLDSLDYPPETWLQIDRLELNIGDLRAEHFEQDLLQGIQQALGDQLPLTAPKNATPPLTEAAQLATALAHFFKYGYLPWWAKHLTDDPNPAALLAALATTNEAQVQALLREWLQNPVTRSRMIYQLSAAQLRQSLYLIEETFAGKAVVWAGELLQLLKQTSMATSEQTEKWIWAALLDWAARQESANLPFSTLQTVLGAVLPYLAAQKNSTLPSIQTALLQAAEQAHSEKPSLLPWVQALRLYRAAQTTASSETPLTRPFDQVPPSPLPADIGPRGLGQQAQDPQELGIMPQPVPDALRPNLGLPQEQAPLEMQHGVVQRTLDPQPIWPLPQLEAVPQRPDLASSKGQESPEAPSIALVGQHGPIQVLLYFLEWGRFPSGSTATLAQLEQDLLAFIQENPEQAASALLGLNKKTNLAARLAQQFSKAVHRATIRLFFPESWQALESLMATAFAQYRSDLPEALVWETALRQLLLRPDAPVDMPLLLQQMAQHLAAKLNRSPDALLLHIQTTADDAEVRQNVDRALGRLTEVEASTLSAELQRWLSPESPLALETSPSLTERIRYRLVHGSPAWWDDDPALSPEALLRALSALAPDARREGFMALWAADLREKWLPQLPEAVFYQLLHDFWGDYASIAALSASALNDVAVEKAITLLAQDLREDFMALALSGRTVDTALLVATALHGFARHTSTPLQTWTNWLAEKAEAATTAGDIRYYRLRSVLREPLESVAPETRNTHPETRTPPSETRNTHPETRNTHPETPNTHSETPNTHSETRNTYPETLRAELQAIWQLLTQGTIPPETPFSNRDIFTQTFRRLSEKHPDLLRPLLREALRQPAAVERLLRHSAKPLWVLLGRLMLAAHFDTALKLRDELFDLWGGLPTPDNRQDLDRPFWVFLFSTAASETPAFTPLSFVEQLVSVVGRAAQFPEMSLWQQLQAASGRVESMDGLLKTILPDLLERRRQTLEKNAQKAPRRPLEVESLGPEDSIALSNAGLVLLAPFLPRYLDALGLLENKQFRDAQAAERAVHLLQYLATNQTETPEHLLVFNKILCGLPVETPVSLGIDLSETEADLSQSLLEGVLQHWEIMQNTSVPNLRGAFLIRDGLLSEKEDRWTLQVESKAYDIVLEYLPWTISMIKLPWMHKRIDVAWRKKS